GERGRGHAGERGQIVVDGQVDGDALRAATRAAGEEADLVEAPAAPEAPEPQDARAGAHGSSRLGSKSKSQRRASGERSPARAHWASRASCAGPSGRWKRVLLARDMS